MKDPSGNWLYVPFWCSGGTCPMYAGDLANPAFRAWWISQARATMAAGNYRGLYIDDVDLLFRVSDGWYNQIPPIDSNTGQPMSYDAWRSYVAQFVEEIRAALPSANLMENIIWFAGPNGVYDADPYIQRQLKTATTLYLERGIASDPGLTGGTGFWSVYSYFNFVDRVHALGKGINFGQYALSPSGQEYGLAGYFLISSGKDSLGDGSTTPLNWFSGYSVDLGPALGPRSYNNGVFQRSFARGMVVLGEPGLETQTVPLPGWYQRLDGSWVNSVTLSGSQGIILQSGSTASTTATVTAPASTGATSHYLSDLTPTSTVNEWGTVQKDKSILGHGLYLNGIPYNKGLGVHAYSELHYSLSAYGGCSSMTAVAGIDDEAPWHVGYATFQIWADGTLLFDSGYLSSGNQAVPVNIDLSGHEDLALLVTNGSYLPPIDMVAWDHGDWANAALNCSK